MNCKRHSLFFNVPCGCKESNLNFDMGQVNIGIISVTGEIIVTLSDPSALNVYKFHFCNSLSHFYLYCEIFW